VIGTGQVKAVLRGPVSMPNYAALAQSAIQTLGDGTKVFVGPRDDPFFVDLAAVFDLLSIRRPPGNKGKGLDGVGGYDVMSVVLQIPKQLLTKDGTSPDPSRANNVIGIWDTAERLKNQVINGDGTISISGPEQQVSRLGMPLVNEIVIPLGKKDLFNASEPANDVANFGAFVVDPEPARLLKALFGINVPPTPRNDLVAVFATGVPGLNQPANVSPGEMLRLNMSIPPSKKPIRFGVLAGDVAGFPNGRRLADDVTDIERASRAPAVHRAFNVAPNNQLGDGVDANDMPFLPYFPYVAPPQNPRDHDHHERADGRGHGGDDDDLGTATSSSLGEDPSALQSDAAKAPSLSLSSGNPGPGAVLQYALPENGRVSLRIFDAQGRVVRTLVEQDAAAGSFRATWDGRADGGGSLSRGVFFARLTAGGRVVDTKKLVLE
jgi:hypothetical protein